MAPQTTTKLDKTTIKMETEIIRTTMPETTNNSKILNNKIITCQILANNKTTISMVSKEEILWVTTKQTPGERILSQTDIPQYLTVILVVILAPTEVMLSLIISHYLLIMTYMKITLIPKHFTLKLEIGL